MWSVLISKVCEMLETSKSFVGKKVEKEEKVMSFSSINK